MKPTAADPHPPSIKHVRRWWLLIPLFVIAALVVLGILVFAKSSTSQFQFLAGVPIQSQREWVHANTPGVDTWVASTSYRSHAVRSEYKAELTSLGWIDEGEIQGTRIFKDLADETRILVTEVGDNLAFMIYEIPPARFTDRVRVWFKDRLPFLARSPK